MEGFTNPIKIWKEGKEVVEDGATGEKFFSKYAGEAMEVGTVANKVADAISRARGFNNIEHFLMNAEKGLLDKLDELVDIERGYKLDKFGHTTEELVEAEADASRGFSRLKKFKDSNLGKAGKYLGKGALKYGVPIAGIGYVIDEYVLPEYDELKRNCQCTCQGFNKVNLNDEKWEQLNKILYCRHDDNSPCDLQGGECPTGCTLKNNSKKSASLYGITNPSNFESDSPHYMDWEGTDNLLCPLNNDSEFRDDFLNYHIKRATELTEVGVASGAALHTEFSSGVISGLGGGATAAATGEFIPSEFPGHCLYRLFDSSSFKTDPDDVTGKEEDQDLKVVKCRGEAGPDAASGSRKKCSLKAGEEGSIVTNFNDYNNRELGTCVAWNKGDEGKCMSVIHAPENVYHGLWNEVRNSKDINCSILNSEATCEESEYCYWKNENNFDDIYMCLNDVTLIKMHNDILDGGGQQNLIKATLDVPLDTPKQKISSDTDRITSLNTYNSGKEMDINDICNAYCNESLCNNPAITTMPAIPGVEDSVDGIKIMIKYGILFGITVLLWNNIISEFFKQKASGVHIQMGMFNINRLLSIGSLMIMLGIVYYYNDIISEKIKLDEFINDKILPLIEENI
tara:strand:+ start:1573 stop:3450 length:1878 start_codon:yes stop_codon:yes gene_type:complete